MYGSCKENCRLPLFILCIATIQIGPFRLGVSQGFVLAAVPHSVSGACSLSFRGACPSHIGSCFWKGRGGSHTCLTVYTELSTGLYPSENLPQLERCWERPMASTRGNTRNAQKHKGCLYIFLVKGYLVMPFYTLPLHYL